MYGTHRLTGDPERDERRQRDVIDATKARRVDAARRQKNAEPKRDRALDYARAIKFYDSRDRAALWKWIKDKDAEHKGDCMDSIRVARADNPGEMKAFESARSCCGSDEDRIVGASGQIYVIGCNYGH